MVVREMETVRLVARPRHAVPWPVWRPVLEIIQFVRHVREYTELVRCQVWEAAKLVVRTLDGITPRTTRMHTQSQLERVYGPLTFSLSSGVIFARPGSELPPGS